MKLGSNYTLLELSVFHLRYTVFTKSEKDYWKVWNMYKWNGSFNTTYSIRIYRLKWNLNDWLCFMTGCLKEYKFGSQMITHVYNIPPLPLGLLPEVLLLVFFYGCCFLYQKIFFSSYQFRCSTTVIWGFFRPEIDRSSGSPSRVWLVHQFFFFHCPYDVISKAAVSFPHHIHWHFCLKVPEADSFPNRWGCRRSN